jgi:lysophospholipase L1-like esterase
MSLLHLAGKAALAPLLLAQGLAVRRRALKLPEAAGARHGRAGRRGASPLALWIVGDSSAAGVGVATQDEALCGCLLRALLARAPGLALHWRLIARTGTSSASVQALLDEELADPKSAAAPARADLAVVVLGVNCVVEQLPTARALALRRALWRRLADEHGVRHALFCAAPPLERFPLLPRPLAGVLGRDAARLNAAQREWAEATPGVRHVELPLAASGLGPEHMASDGFHPGARIYEACGAALADAALAAWAEAQAAAAPLRFPFPRHDQETQP